MHLSSQVFRFCIPSILLVLAACESPQQAVELPQAEVQVIQSPNDKRAYRYVAMENGLQVLAISDPETDKSAAALVVFRGSMHDPVEHAGLAHFLEHMLFIGTAKYPEVDGYQQFISAGGGSSNAYTAPDHTNYFFDIAPDRFPEALDRFAQFFISPLFSPEYVDREKNAVHSEYQLQLKDDGWRGNAVEKLAMNPDHPASRFSIGNLSTLDGELQEALLEWFRNNYSADQMSLVVLDPRPLDDIESLILERFSDIPNHQLGSNHPSEPAYRADTLPARLTYKPIKELRQVTYRFPVPSVQPHYRAKPEIYITNLLGHEGIGSLFHTLKARGWVTQLFAGVSNQDVDDSAVEVSMRLTPAGIDHLRDIDAYLFAYIDLLKAEVPLAWRYDEQARVSELGFQFVEKSSAIGSVYQLAPAFMWLPPEDVLRARYLMEDFDAALIQTYLSKLTPENLLVVVQDPDAETNLEEQWFGVPYKLEPYTPNTSLDAELAASMSLPVANPFLPENLDLVASSEGPVNIESAQPADVWHHADSSFGTPKANLRMSLQVPGGITTPEDVAAAELYVRLVTDALNPVAYPTYLAGMSYGLAALPGGIRLQIGGYSDKQLTLLGKILQSLKSLEIDPDRLTVLKAKLQEDIANTLNDRPYNQAMSALVQAMVTSDWPSESILTALEDIDIDALEQWREAHLTRVGLLFLAHGNVNDARALQAAELVTEQFEVIPQDVEAGEVVELSDAANLRIDVDHTDAAFIAYMQDADSSFATRARSALTVQLLKQGYFTSLRTEQQLGYVVAMINRVLRQRGSIAFLVQSPVAGPSDLYSATQRFVREQVNAVSELSEETFAASKEGLLVRLRQADENLGQRTGRYWADLVEEIHTLDSRERIAQEVEAVTLEEIKAYIAQLPQRLADGLVVSVPGQFEALSREGKVYDSVVAFKQAQSTVDKAAASESAPRRNAALPAADPAP